MPTNKGADFRPVFLFPGCSRNGIIRPGNGLWNRRFVFAGWASTLQLLGNGVLRNAVCVFAEGRRAWYFPGTGNQTECKPVVKRRNLVAVPFSILLSGYHNAHSAHLPSVFVAATLVVFVFLNKQINRVNSLRFHPRHSKSSSGCQIGDVVHHIRQGNF